MLDCVEIEPEAPAGASVLWLHGLGADGHDFVPIVPLLGLPPELRVRFVFPHAPRMPVTINMGMVMRAWYDISALDLREEQDEAGVRRSAEQVERLLDREAERGVAPERTVLAGFSQGGVIALHAGLRRPQPLAGILALSTYLALDAALEAEGAPAGRSTPVFMGHGRYDPVVPLERGRASRDRLLEAGHRVEWREYDVEHGVAPDEIADVGAWLVRVLNIGTPGAGSS